MSNLHMYPVGRVRSGAFDTIIKLFSTPFVLSRSQLERNVVLQSSFSFQPRLRSCSIIINNNNNNGSFLYSAILHKN